MNQFKVGFLFISFFSIMLLLFCVTTTHAGPLIYSFFLGGNSDNAGSRIVVDNSGNIYIAGSTYSPDFPTTINGYDTSTNGRHDGFVTKFNSAGSLLIYSTYIGGSNNDSANGLAIDNDGNVYITGNTNSTDFPTTPGAFDNTYNGGTPDIFVSKLNNTGSALIYSTYLDGGGENNSVGIAVDNSGNASIAGWTNSGSFPTTSGAFRTGYCGGYWDGFVSKLNADGSALVYSTYLGGWGWDRCYGMTADNEGNTYVTGYTQSANFPVTAGAYNTMYNNADTFITKFNSAGTALVYSTFIGGNDYDEGNGIVVDNDRNAYVTGITQSSNFPTTPYAFDTTPNGGIDVFVCKLNSAGSSLLYSTYLGGANSDEGLGIAIDPLDNAYVVGLTLADNFPTTIGAFDNTHNGLGYDGFVSKLSNDGTRLIYSTYLGGSSVDACQSIAVDDSGNGYVTGSTVSSDFPVIAGSFDTTYHGGNDAFVTKLSFIPLTSIETSVWMFYDK